MDTESGRERERESECERGLKYLWSTTSQGSAGLQHCPPGEQVDSVSVPAGPSWQPPDGSLVSITWMCTHSYTFYIYIYIYVCCIYLFHSLSSTVLPFCPPVWAAWDLYMAFDFYCICHMFTMWWQVHGPVAWMTRGKGDSTLIWHDLAVRCKMTVARDKRTAMFISLSSLDLYWIDLIIVPSHHALFQVSLRFAVVTTFQEIHLLV